MDLLDRLLQHDAWTTRQLLLIADRLPHPDLDREFDLGRRTLRNTFVHIIRNIEVWTDHMRDRPDRPPAGDSPGALIARLDAASPDLAALAQEIRARDAWDERWADPRDPSIQRTFGGTIAHVITHSMHHRAQILYMLRTLGVDTPEGDVLSWESHAHGTPPS